MQSIGENKVEKAGKCSGFFRYIQPEEIVSDTRLLVIGLGNPGNSYKKTRHNAGFLVLDHFAEKNNLDIRTEKMQGLFGTGTLAGKKLLLLKPMTYMNRSGECVGQFMSYFKIPPENILVIHDDLDLKSGRLKMVSGGGPGGHNGIRSLISHLGTKDFARLKIGIGHPRDDAERAGMPVEKYVLTPFSDDEWNQFHDNLALIGRGITLFVEEGLKAAMNVLNRRQQDEEI